LAWGLDVEEGPVVKNGAELVIDCELDVGTADEEDIVAVVDGSQKKGAQPLSPVPIRQLMGSSATAT
jgi:hypothetical protein